MEASLFNLCIIIPTISVKERTAQSFGALKLFKHSLKSAFRITSNVLTSMLWLSFGVVNLGALLSGIQWTCSYSMYQDLERRTVDWLCCPTFSHSPANLYLDLLTTKRERKLFEELLTISPPFSIYVYHLVGNEDHVRARLPDWGMDSFKQQAPITYVHVLLFVSIPLI